MHNERLEFLPKYKSLADMVEQQVQLFPERQAFVFEEDGGQTISWTYAQLAERARTLGQWIRQQVQVGDRVLLVYPPGLEFIAAFLGCSYAGAVPVPATYPKPRRPLPRLDAIVEDCQPSLVLTRSSVIDGLCLDRQSPAISALVWQATDRIPTESNCRFVPGDFSGNDLAFLQYTSGSTSEPRGVMVSHGNILHNLEAIRQGFEIQDSDIPRAVFWLPAYHDLGLIGAILSPLYVGGTSTLMAPSTFLRWPQRWLELISTSQASISGAPNFAYEFVARKTAPAERSTLDLRHWKTAFCGAEPINPATLIEFAQTFAECGFQPSAFFPCYGLAEATLFVTGGKLADGPRVIDVDRLALQEHRVARCDDNSERTQSLVGCGPACPGLSVEIVDPLTHNLCGTNAVGEIWVRGDSVARGYWKKEIDSADTFRAQLATNDPNHKKNFLRTGDLGFLHEGELFVTGRLKDLIIVRGRNHYPQDLERTAEGAHPAVDVGTAFSVDVAGREELVLVHQWRRENRPTEYDQILQAIRMSILEEHEIDPHAIVLIRPASLPVTSSGKVQRQRCREMFLHGELAVTAQWINHHEADPLVEEIADDLTKTPDFLERAAQLTPAELQIELQIWLVNWLSARANLLPGTMQPDTPFSRLGIDSLTAVEVSQELDQLLGLKSPPMLIWTCPNPRELAEYLARELHAAKA